MTSSAAMRFVGLFALAGCGSTPPRVDFANAKFASLRGVQCELANGRAEQALQAVDDLEMTYVSGAAPLGPAERMWLLVYRGFSLDLLGRRDEAVAAYREAGRIHDCPIASDGAAHPLHEIDHLAAMRGECTEG